MTLGRLTDTSTQLVSFWLVQATDAENRVTAYSYDAVGRRTLMTDARGITVTSTFDDAGQLTDQVSPNETRSFAYDDAGRRTGWSDASGVTTVTFDGVGRMTEIVTAAGTVGYGFNAAGEQVSMTQPEGTVTTSYDTNGYMASVTDWRGDSFTMTNDADGRMLTTARSNGVDTAYSYDSAGRLTDIAHSNGATTLESFAYTLDPNGNRTAVTSTAGAESYTLDPLNRITAATYPGGLTEAFSYDAAGNRTSHTNTDGTTIGYTVDATGQLVSDTSGTTYSYDDAGNLTATSTGDSYSWDDFGRMTNATTNGATQTYVYDVAGVRVDADGQGQLWDRNGLPTLISTGTDNYVHTAGVARDGDDWLLADAVGSVRATVDNTGATIGSQDFTVYGEQLNGSGVFGYAGEQVDPTGLLHLRARQYNPALGRFTTVDPVQPGAPATTGWNLYTYAGNNPTTWGDPSGRTLVDYDASLTPARTTAAGSSAAAAEVAYLNSLYYGATATTSGSAIAAAGGATSTIGSSLFAKFVIGTLGLGAGGLLLGGDTPQPEPEPPIIAPPVVNAPEPGGPEPEPEPQLATDGAGARDGGDVCDAISVDDALQRISDFLGGDGRLVVSGSGNYQWIVTEQVGSSTVTRIGRLDINPNSPHVVRFGPHVNLETQIDGKTQRSGSLADPHIEVDASTVREGDYPSC